MILLAFFLCVPAVLFVWRLCAVAGAADDQMEAAFQRMKREKQNVSQAVGGDPPDKEDAYEG